MNRRFEEKWVLVRGESIAFYLFTKCTDYFNQYDIMLNDWYLLDVLMVDEQPYVTKVKNFSEGGEWVNV